MTSELTLDQLTEVTGGCTGQQDREFQMMNAKQKKHLKHNVEGLTLEEALAGKRNRQERLHENNPEYVDPHAV